MKNVGTTLSRTLTDKESFLVAMRLNSKISKDDEKQEVISRLFED